MAVKQGDEGVQVRKIQLLLNSLLKPTPSLKIDGRFGPLTQQAVKSFQESKNLSADGIVGPKTLVALGLNSVLGPTSQAISPQAPWMDIAIAELGVHEDSLPGQHNRRIVEYHQTTSCKATDDETPWCSSFVNWVMEKAGKRGTNSAAAKDWLNWGVPVDHPTPGVITVIRQKGGGSATATGSSSGYHVAFFVSLNSSCIRLLGGNQTDRVRYSNFPLSEYEIKGYRRPI